MAEARMPEKRLMRLNACRVLLVAELGHQGHAVDGLQMQRRRSS